MMYRVLPLVVAVLALAVAFQANAVAQDKDKTHDGIVVKAGDMKLTMTDKDGKNEHTHNVAKAAKISCDGKDCKLDDLKKGFAVKVTTGKEDGKDVATKIDAKKN